MFPNGWRSHDRDHRFWQEMERMVAMSRAQEVDVMTKNQTLQQSWRAQLPCGVSVCQGFKMNFGISRARFGYKFFRFIRFLQPRPDIVQKFQPVAIPWLSAKVWLWPNKHLQLHRQRLATRTTKKGLWMAFKTSQNILCSGGKCWRDLGYHFTSAYCCVSPLVSYCHFGISFVQAASLQVELQKAGVIFTDLFLMCLTTKLHIYIYIYYCIPNCLGWWNLDIYVSMPKGKSTWMQIFTVRISRIGKGQELCILGARRVLGNEMCLGLLWWLSSLQFEYKFRFQILPAWL